MPHTEVAVIGGGPSGSIIGALLAEEGYETTIFDRSSFPRKKLCGEFIAPGGVRALSDLGLLERLKEAGGIPIKGFSFTTSDGITLSESMHRPGLALSRKRLDVLLLGHARDCGATIQTRARVTSVDSDFGGRSPSHEFQVQTAAPQDRWHGTNTCGLMVGAYGRRTKLDRKLNRPFFDNRSPYVGFQRHYHVSPGTGSIPRRVELYLVPGGYCGLTCIEQNLVNVCMMIHGSALPDHCRSWSDLCRCVLSENDRLRSRLSELSPAEEEVRSVAQIPLQQKEPFREPLLFTGDATGMIAPLTGNGQASAIRSGINLAHLIKEYGIPESRSRFEELGERWTNLWNARFSGQITIGRLLNTLLRYPSSGGAAVKFLRYTPSITSFLQEYITSGRPPLYNE